MSKLSRSLNIIINRLTKRNEQQIRALGVVDSLAEDINKFLAKYRLQKHTTNFRVFFENIAVARIDLIGIKVKSLKTARIAKDIRRKDLSPLLSEVHNNLEEFRNALSLSTIDRKVVGNCADELRDSHKKLLEVLSLIEHK
jgi:hypothetical protein